RGQHQHVRAQRQRPREVHVDEGHSRGNAMKQLFDSAIRFVLGVLRFIHEKCWTEPERSRGATWTVAFWLCVMCVVRLCSLMPRTAWPSALVLIACLLVLRWENAKPKKLGRPLPYRRRR